MNYDKECDRNNSVILCISHTEKKNVRKDNRKSIEKSKGTSLTTSYFRLCKLSKIVVFNERVSPFEL